jgi:hypothetical protein
MMAAAIEMPGETVACALLSSEIAKENWLRSVKLLLFSCILTRHNPSLTCRHTVNSKSQPQIGSLLGLGFQIAQTGMP